MCENIYNIQIEHLQLATRKPLLQRKTGTGETFGTYYCNICVKHMQHPDQNACNIHLEQMKHFEQTLTTCLQNICNICNMCNISDLLLQYP